MTAVQPPGRYGALEIADNRVRGFTEKPPGDGGCRAREQRGSQLQSERVHAASIACAADRQAAAAA